MNAEAHMRKAELDLVKCLLAEIDAELVASQTAESEAYDKLAEARKTIKSLRKKLVAAYNQRDEARKVAECPFPFKRRTECEVDLRQLQQTRSLRSARSTKGERP